MTNDYTQKLKDAIDRYLNTDVTRRSLGAVKGRITRLVNELAQNSSPTTARETVLALVLGKEYLPHRSDQLKNQFTVGSLYLNGADTFGWWDDGSVQVQAESLPLERSGSTFWVNFYGFKKDIGLWHQRGFEVAQDLPVNFWYRSLVVHFPVDKAPFWLEYGYALPCPLQWERNEDRLLVTRTIMATGYWCAYRWWEGCKWWYYEKHPEWFSDDPVFGELERPYYFAPEPDSAVLGGLK